MDGQSDDSIRDLDIVTVESDSQYEAFLKVHDIYKNSRGKTKAFADEYTKDTKKKLTWADKPDATMVGWLSRKEKRLVE